MALGGNKILLLLFLLIFISFSFLLRDDFSKHRALLGTADIFCLAWHKFAETIHNSVFGAETAENEVGFFFKNFRVEI